MNETTTIERANGREVADRSGDGAGAYKTFERVTAKQVEMACGHCGRSIFLMPSSVRANAFCNQACCTAWKRTRRGPGAGGWRGGVHFHSEGYIRLYQPDHPHASGNGYVFLHRLVAEQKLGRYLDPAETVHHINGNKMDNDPDNLIVFASTAEHSRHHGIQRGGINGRSIARAAIA